VSWVCFMPISLLEPDKHSVPCHKRIPAVVIECVEAAILEHSSGSSVRALFSRQVADVI